jgi:hypothetical protein
MIPAEQDPAHRPSRPGYSTGDARLAALAGMPLPEHFAANVDAVGGYRRQSYWPSVLVHPEAQMPHLLNVDQASRFATSLPILSPPQLTSKGTRNRTLLQHDVGAPYRERDCRSFLQLEIVPTTLIDDQYLRWSAHR